MHLELTEDEKAKIKKLTVMTGVVKKKRDKGTVIALVSASEQKYFCFKGMGRFLVHYADKKKPGLYDKPESVIFVNEIKEIVDNYEGKKSHFYLKMENEGIHMKCDEQKEKERWVESLRGLMEIFKGKKILDGTVQGVKQDFKENLFSLQAENIPAAAGSHAFEVMKTDHNNLTVKIHDGFSPNDVLSHYISNGAGIISFKEILPSLNDIFIKLVEGTPTARQFENVTP